MDFGMLNNPDNAEKKVMYPHIMAMLFVLLSTEFTNAVEKFCFVIFVFLRGSTEL